MCAQRNRPRCALRKLGTAPPFTAFHYMIMKKILKYLEVMK